MPQVYEAERDRRLRELADRVDADGESGFETDSIPTRPVHSSAGETFPSLSAAARAYGTTAHQVSRACVEGWRCRGVLWSFVGDPLPSPPVVVVSDAGEEWSSVAEAADHLGVAIWKVRRRIHSRIPVAGRTLSRGPDHPALVGNRRR